MLKISQIDEKNIRIQQDDYADISVAAIFYATAGATRIVHIRPFFGNIPSFRADISDLEINGAPAPSSVNEAVSLLNSFIGIFKAGGGTSSTTLRSFEAGKHYLEGQAIAEDGVLYIASVNFEAGDTFDPGDWTRIGVAPGELESKQNKLVAGDNMEISDEDDPLSPVIRAKTIQPDTAAEEGQIADARKTAAMIAEAARSTHNRGKVISAYTPVTVYSLHPGFAITTGSSGYQLGDSLQYGLKYIDILLVVTAVDTEGAVTDVSVSSLGASDVDFAPEGGATILPMHGGHGTGFSIQAESGADLGTILSDIVSPQPNDEVRVVLDETHSGQSWDWVYADYNGDGIHNWVSLAPAGGTRDFYLNPLETGEIEDSAVTDAKLGSRTLTDADRR